jgi:hypothetical protein
VTPQPIVSCSQANYLVCRKGCVALAAVQAFIAWMREQADEIQTMLHKFMEMG